MLDKIKDLGNQVASRAGDAVGGLANSVKDGVGTLTESINEKAVRASTTQMCNILEIALDEIRQRPIAERPLTLTATVNFGIASLDMQIQLDGLPPPPPATPSTAD